MESSKMMHTTDISQIQTTTFKEDFVENIYEYTMQQQFMENENLQNAKICTKDKDYANMTIVKTAMQDLTNILQAPIPKVPEEKVAFREKMKQLENSYTMLITACNTYIEAHPHPRTTAAKERLRMIKGTLSMASKEQAELEQALKQLLGQALQTGEQNLVWGNVLGIIRGLSFNLKDNMKLEHTGGATSDVTVLKTSKDKKYFYKSDEKLQSPRDAIAEEYKNLKNEEEKKILEQILPLLDHQIDRKKDNRHPKIHLNINYAKIDYLFAIPEKSSESPFRIALQKKDTRQAHNMLKEFFMKLKKTEMPDLKLDINNQRTWKFLNEILLKYDRLKSRFDACAYAGIESENSLSDRNVASSRMATLLGVPSLIVATNKATLHENGKTIENGKGIVMSQAKGKSHYDLQQKAKKSNKRVYLNTEAMRQFSCLQLLDTICGQIDRHGGNRFVSYIEEDGNFIITGIQGIDNDLCFGDLHYIHLDNKEFQLPVFDKGWSHCTLPFIDKGMVESMRQFTPDNLQYYFGDLLEQKYIDALWDRIKTMLKIIDLSIKNKNTVLLEKEEWNNEEVVANYSCGYK